MSAQHVTGTATWSSGRLELNDLVIFNAGMRGLKPGDGEQFVVRVEREADALSEAQRRYYFAACIRPLSDHTGFTEPEMHLMVKAVCLPPDKTSITQLSKDEMHTFITNVQRWAAEIVGLVLEDPARHGAAA